LQHIPRKRFGQHFLHERGVITRIVDEIDLQADDLVVEIGPGLGALTDHLLPKLKHLHVVELDRDLAKIMRERYPAERLTVHEGDALEFDFSQFGNPIRLVGNLPYNISTPLLFHFATFRDGLRDGHFMLQREVVDRMVAAPSTAAYGRLSVSLQLDFAMESLFRIGPGAFTPPPKVESAIVRLTPLREKKFDLRDREIFSAIVSRAFTQRRKTLRNSLRDYLTPEDFLVVEIDPMARAENLSVADYVRIANRIALRSPARASLQA
jgi:16S rRNA (adenine1518-N6/adenine1519-N6)-dimethyltransferase